MRALVDWQCLHFESACDAQLEGSPSPKLRARLRVWVLGVEGPVTWHTTKAAAVGYVDGFIAKNLHSLLRMEQPA